MLDCIFNPITLPPYHSVKHLEGTGNFAVDKYYKWPFRPFYRKKLYMMRDMLDKERIYTTIMDFGSGAKIFVPELKKHANQVKCMDKDTQMYSFWRFKCITAGSVFEFVEDLEVIVRRLWTVSPVNGQLIVASPLDTFMSSLYLRTIKGYRTYNSKEKILTTVDKYFKVVKYREWMGLYFCFKAVRRD